MPSVAAGLLLELVEVQLENIGVKKVSLSLKAILAGTCIAQLVCLWMA